MYISNVMETKTMVIDLIRSSDMNFCQVQLIRIECRVPEFGWTTQKVFHFLNFIVNSGEFIVVLTHCLLSTP
jgi:hypothetical protein